MRDKSGGPQTPIFLLSLLAWQRGGRAGPGQSVGHSPPWVCWVSTFLWADNLQGSPVSSECSPGPWQAHCLVVTNAQTALDKFLVTQRIPTFPLTSLASSLEWVLSLGNGCMSSWLARTGLSAGALATWRTCQLGTHDEEDESSRPCGCYYSSASSTPQQSPSVPCDAMSILPCVTIPGQGDRIEEMPDTLMNVREEMTKCHGYYLGLGLGVSEAGFSGGQHTGA